MASKKEQKKIYGDITEKELNKLQKKFPDGNIEDSLLEAQDSLFLEFSGSMEDVLEGLTDDEKNASSILLIAPSALSEEDVVSKTLSLHDSDVYESQIKEWRQMFVGDLTPGAVAYLPGNSSDGLPPMLVAFPIVNSTDAITEENLILSLGNTITLVQMMHSEIKTVFFETEKLTQSYNSIPSDVVKECLKKAVFHQIQFKESEAAFLLNQEKNSVIFGIID